MRFWYILFNPFMARACRPATNLLKDFVKSIKRSTAAKKRVFLNILAMIPHSHPVIKGDFDLRPRYQMGSCAYMF